jgi:hypothetical protein
MGIPCGGLFPARHLAIPPSDAKTRGSERQPALGGDSNREQGVKRVASYFKGIPNLEMPE